MELTDYIRILRKNWLIIVLAAVLGVGVAAAYSLTRTPMYDAQSTVFVSTQAGGSIGDWLRWGTWYSAEKARAAPARALSTSPAFRATVPGARTDARSASR